MFSSYCLSFHKLYVVIKANYPRFGRSGKRVEWRRLVRSYEDGSKDHQPWTTTINGRKLAAVIARNCGQIAAFKSRPRRIRSADVTPGNVIARCVLQVSDRPRIAKCAIRYAIKFIYILRFHGNYTLQDKFRFLVKIIVCPFFKVSL